MYDKFLRIIQMAGAVGWIAIVVAAVFSIIQSIITGDFSPMLGVIVLVLVAINFNLSMLVGYKRREFQNVESLLLKADEISRPTGPPGRANPYLN